MTKFLDLLLEWVFRRESLYAEAVSGVLLLVLAIQSQPYFVSEHFSSAMLIAIGVMQLCSLLMFKCKQCYATRILTSAAGSFAWLVVASHQFERMTEMMGSTMAALVGSLVLAATMALAVINTIRVRCREINSQ